MIAVEIQVNGQPVATCGADAVRQLVALVAARGLVETISSATGARSPERGIDELLKWVSGRIAGGDDVTLRFVDGAEARASGG